MGDVLNQRKTGKLYLKPKKVLIYFREILYQPIQRRFRHVATLRSFRDLWSGAEITPPAVRVRRKAPAVRGLRGWVFTALGRHLL